MPDIPSDGLPKDQWDIVFKYYQEQWAHVRHHESLRSALTVQVLVSAAAVVTGYIQLKLDDPASLLILRVALSTLAIGVGVAGFIAVVRIETAASIHIKRARAAREGLGFLERYASKSPAFPELRPVYLAFHTIVVLLGVVLLVAAFVTFCSAHAPIKTLQQTGAASQLFGVHRFLSGPGC
jgi:hypothetical protein